MFEEEERGVAEEIQGTKLCAVTQSCLCLLKICLFVLSEPPAQPTHESHCVDVPLCSMQHRLNGPLNLLIFPVGSAPSMQSWIVIYGVVESNTPISCLGTGVQWDQLQMATVRVLQRWCASPSSSRQPVAVKSPPPPLQRCPWCWREQKHQSRSSPPRSSRAGRGPSCEGGGTMCTWFN